MNLPPNLAQETLDALTLNLAVLDSDGVIIASNRAWQQFGHFNGIEEPADTVGQNYLHITEEADDEYAQQAAQGLRAVLDKECNAFQLEYPCHSPTEKRWFLMHASRFTTDGEIYVVVAHENITIRKQSEREVQRRNDDLEAFSRLLSHDLRSPLNVAQGHVELLQEETDSEHAETVQSALNRMNALIEDALTILRDENRSIDRTPLSLRSVATRAWETVDTRGATLEIEEDREIQADAGLLTNVFENLFRNAVEHAGSDVTITVGPLDDGFYVEDDGPGIPEEHRDDVFEIGFTTSAGGTGFGLGIVRHIIEDHGWEIDLETGQTEGTRFEIHTQPSYPGSIQPRSVQVEK